jgi:hypothetical protein
MKLDGLVAAAMMMGTLTAVACKSRNADDGAVAPEENPDTAPVVTAVAADQASPGRTYSAPVAPPPAPAGFEIVPAARNDRLVWAPGYYRWNGSAHVWVAGQWITRREGHTWVNPRWEERGGRWHYRPGYWHRH